MSIKFAVLYPGHLNLNGDLANIKVLRRRLDWAGVSSTIQVVEIGQSIDADADFIIIGHGSIAAWDAIRADFNSRKNELNSFVSRGIKLLAIATGYEMLYEQTAAGVAGLGLFPGRPMLQNRVSKFEVVEFEASEILGYLNSEAKLPKIARQGSVLAINLHGPVLAKNPQLADDILSDLLKAHGLSANVLRNKKAAYADGLVAEVWKLEKELSSE